MNNTIKRWLGRCSNNHYWWVHYGSALNATNEAIDIWKEFDSADEFTQALRETIPDFDHILLNSKIFSILDGAALLLKQRCEPGKRS